MVIGLLIAFNSVLGTVVILRNPRAPLNKAFLLMTLGITLWAASSNLSDATTDFTLSRYAAFVAFGSGFFGFCAAYLFSEVFRHGKLEQKHIVFMTIGTLLSIVYSTPLVYSLDTVDTYHNGILYLPFILSCLVVLALIIRNFVAVIRRGSPQQRNHARFIVAGFVGMAVLALVTNAIVPAIVEVTWVTKLGPAFTTVFIASVAYTMIRHRLFDIRFAVARTLAYVLTIAVIALLYSVILIGVLSRFIHMQYASWLQQVAYVVMAVILSATFQPIKRFFDRVTNKWFYQDAYNPQELFNSLNKVLVSSLDVKYLMEKSTEVIAENLKTQYCAIGLARGRTDYRLFGHGYPDFDPADVAKVRHLTPSFHQGVIITDFLDEAKYAELRGLLQKNGIAALVRITQNVKRTEEGLGYIVLGVKKSGGLYSQQDSRALESIANGLVVAIQNALRFEESQHFNIVLQEKVEEATRKLRTTNEKLRQLDDTKDDFISMASHQLRTPLTSVKGYLSMVLEGDAGKISGTQRKMLSQAYTSSQRMVYLIADLLNVSRLKTGKFVIEASPTNLADMVGEEIDQLVETAAARGIELTYEKPAKFPQLELDETKTRQVIMNFIDNAIYYTRSGGHINVVLEDAPTSVELKVIDDGIGVPKSEQHHLFTKFYRAGNARKARPDGTGLGLFMAKKVVLAQGGSVIFESKEGKGSMFGFLFPKNPKTSKKPLPVVTTKSD